MCSSYYWKVRSPSKFTEFCLSPLVQGVAPQLFKASRTIFLLFPCYLCSWWSWRCDCTAHPPQSSWKGECEYLTACLKTAIFNILDNIYARSVDIQIRDGKPSEIHLTMALWSICSFQMLLRDLEAFSFPREWRFKNWLLEWLLQIIYLSLHYWVPFYNSVFVIRLGQGKQWKENTKVIKYWKRS